MLKAVMNGGVPLIMAFLYYTYTQMDFLEVFCVSENMDFSRYAFWAFYIIQHGH